jgi:uncharacterized protein RhaS with RHS repeats
VERNRRERKRKRERERGRGRQGERVLYQWVLGTRQRGESVEMDVMKVTRSQRATDASPTLQRQQKKQEVCAEVVTVLKKRGNPVADQPGFADELLVHFNQLPTRSGFSLPSCFCRRPFWVPFANSHVSRSWVPARNSRLHRERERERGDV